MAIESDKRGPVKIELPEGGEADAASATTGPSAPTLASSGAAISLPSTPRKKPPRVRKPSRNHDQCVAPTPDLEAHRAALREAFGDKIADEFTDQTYRRRPIEVGRVALAWAIVCLGWSGSPTIIAIQET